METLLNKMITSKLKLAPVCIDDPEGGFLVPPTPAYIEDRRWNGFVIPYFTKENAEVVMAEWNKKATEAEGAMWFDPQRDGYCVSFDSTEEMEAYEGEDVEIDGQTVHVYGIGAGVWVWDLEPEPEEPEYDEPSHDDTVLCCPDCERPNQFGEQCAECERERWENS